MSENNMGELAAPVNSNDNYNLAELGAPFSMQLEFGVLKQGMKENETSSTDLWKPPITKLRPIQGFNVRVKNAAYWARVERYANSMIQHGYLPHKPMAGYVGRDPATGENVIFYTAGYTRMDSIVVANRKLLAAGKPTITHTTMVVHSRDDTTPRKLNALLITENEASPYNPYEASIVCKRMLDDGASIEEIAEEVNFTTVWVESLLKLAAAPIELQRMVVDDIIKPTFAIETIETHGDKALAILQEALARKMGVAPAPAPAPEAADAPAAALAPTGATTPALGHADGDAGADPETDQDATPRVKNVRLTAKDLVKPEVRKFDNAVKKKAPVMYAALSDMTSHKAFSSFPKETRETVLELLAELKKLEKDTEAPAADPNQIGLFGEDAAAAPASDNAASKPN